MPPPPSAPIRIHGARQHNLKNISLDIHTGTITVFTGVSGSGKSSLVFDTLYAEGQRRYVETFSAYARQFLDRMDKPAVDKIEGIPAAIAIDQSNPVRTSRSTVGTMTELNDHLKLLFARAAQLFDRQTAQAVRQDSVASILADLAQRMAALKNANNTPELDDKIHICFPLELPANCSDDDLAQWLAASGFTRTQRSYTDSNAAEPSATPKRMTDVIVDRLRYFSAEPQRLTDAIEICMRHAQGRVHIYPSALGADPTATWRYSNTLHCPDSGLSYSAATPSLFSFNSPHGACPTCKGFGRTIGVDWGLVIPNPKLTLSTGAIKPFQTPAWRECQDDLLRHAESHGIPRHTPWTGLSPEQQKWVMQGEPGYREGQWSKKWYGVARFFAYLESKAYKMHIRVLLSKYRSYTTCATCAGARLNSQALLWRVGSKTEADAVLTPSERFMPQGLAWSRTMLENLPGLHLHDMLSLPIEALQRFFSSYQCPEPALAHLLSEIQTRLRYLCEVGLGYLSLDRQSRTLSGGEVQRINLTTALGTSLVNTLFVLDEPSIGLHPRDINRITEAMQRLRDAGNTLVVVEHDPAIIMAADRVLDIGPGAGEAGGNIVFDGPAHALAQSPTLTGSYLGGRKHIGLSGKKTVPAHSPKLLLQGARQHNLKNIDLEIPLGHMVGLTGVSGSGKSTLVQDILAPALLRHFGKSTDSPGQHDALLGAEYLADVVFVDQSPIGKTTRSNPASYVGAWDAVRTLFAQTPLACERGYRSATFSFNSGDGRCPGCGGSGFEHVEMQFLSDVYLRCQDCNGSRYRPQILEVTLERQGQTYNVADVLNMTVSEACTAFCADREVLRVLQPLLDVGLDYLRLGQAVPTLSGGEAQRLKLAGHLAANKTSARKTPPARSLSQQNLARRGTLYLFDEPTTGLHFDDIAKLMQSLRRLIADGHSVLLIEHNLDVIRACDWIIDLGPEGGAGGGHILACGSPEHIQNQAHSHTGAALRAYAEHMTHTQLTGTQRNSTALRAAEPQAQYTRAKTAAANPAQAIHIHNAQEHNLKNLSVTIPLGQFNAITGVSGCGKSTLAFDIVFNEGQRRYLESLNAYARSLVQPAGRPEVDAVHGIPPTVAIEQRLSRGGQKSTVGTATEIWHFLRLLFVKLGIQHCIHDGTPVAPQSETSIVAHILKHHHGQHIGILAPLIQGRKGLYTDLAARMRKSGYSHLRVNQAFLPTAAFPRLDRYHEHHIEVPIADFHVGPEIEAPLREAVKRALEFGKNVLHVLAPLDGLAENMASGGDGAFLAQQAQLSTHSTQRACPLCATSYTALDPRLFSYNSKHGWCNDCLGTGLTLSKDERKRLDPKQAEQAQRGREQNFAEIDLDHEIGAQPHTERAPCPSCQGSRLNPTARAVRFHNTGITELGHMTVGQLRTWLDTITDALSPRERSIAIDLLPEIRSRLDFLNKVGLGYLSLDRAAPTLSGGEAQRIRLAAQLGSNLQGVCYVLDEPTIGLHTRDNTMLLGALRQLTDQGNTLVVVEHDKDTILQADHIIDIGPGAGTRGGQVVAQGTVADIAASPESQTGRYLRLAMPHPLHPRRPCTPTTSATDPEQSAHYLHIRGAHLHNLKHTDAAIPLQRLVALTGVSGSGKSTLARDILLPNLQQALRERASPSSWSGCQHIEGWQDIVRVLEVDQTPIGKTPRSCPATYIGFWDHIRKLYADTLEAKTRGYGPGRFSFNTGEGRCPDCEGQGMRTIEMSFLPDVKVPCETCAGQRFNSATLEVLWREHSIGDILRMEIDQALPFFAAMPHIAHPLQLLHDIGLGYLALGQPSPTLSGGEAQRLKLVSELVKVRDDITRRGQKAPHTLYVLDEPTVGLHMADVEKLIHILHRLVRAGHSVLVIEHDLDLIAEADWIIDLGPEGGTDGGRIVAQGSPETLADSNTHTGIALRKIVHPIQ